jgi:hypothetical protein
MDSNERKKQIRAVAAALISNDQEIARPKASSTDMTEKNRLFGRNMLYLSVLTAILGLYLNDFWWQIMFIFFSLTLAAIGLWRLENPTKRPFKGLFRS